MVAPNCDGWWIKQSSIGVLNIIQIWQYDTDLLSQICNFQINLTSVL